MDRRKKRTKIEEGGCKVDTIHKGIQKYMYAKQVRPLYKQFAQNSLPVTVAAFTSPVTLLAAVEALVGSAS